MWGFFKGKLFIEFKIFSFWHFSENLRFEHFRELEQNGAIETPSCRELWGKVSQGVETEGIGTYDARPRARLPNYFLITQKNVALAPSLCSS